MHMRGNPRQVQEQREWKGGGAGGKAEGGLAVGPEDTFISPSSPPLSHGLTQQSWGWGWRHDKPSPPLSSIQSLSPV